MTGKKDWFINLDESKKSTVKFEDDSKLVSQGIGKVMIKRRDGKGVLNEGLQAEKSFVWFKAST